MQRALRPALLLGVLVCALSAFASTDTLFPIYERYLAVIQSGDLAKAKTFLTTGKAKETKSIADLDVISPKNDVAEHDEIIEGDDATLIVTADVDGNPSKGTIQFAREGGRWKILSEMWDLGADPDDEAEEEANDVIQPATDAARDAIRKLREKGFPRPTADFLVMTAVTGDLEAVKLFVAAGYSPDTKSNGSPAIVSAAMYGHADVVQFLIEQHANVNAVDDVNTTALMRGADKCDATKMIRALLKAGAHVDVKSAGGATALQLAEWSGCTANAAAIRGAAR
ncbi:MAG TPA: ankyrin repeat domain-containing protein [Thermoanaerobaculia bacterium]|nr:ankyrin repeat domain-containing protein [Thermoanaerobaculia bacterium]